MKTTIEIPDPLYKRAKIRAVESGQTLKQLVLIALQRGLDTSEALAEPKANLPFRERRQLLSEFETAMRSGAFRPATGTRDVTDLISEDRDAR